MPQTPARPLRLLESVPNKVYNRLIVRYPFQSNRDYAHAYHFAAQRLASTYRGAAEDDLILLPLLTLYRQAFELELKNLIRLLVRTRVTYVDGPTAELDRARSDGRLRELGHNLHKLLNEAKKHYVALDLKEPFPSEVEELIAMLHQADKTGTAFRYAGQLPDTQENADFPDLVALLDQQYVTLVVTSDYVDGIFSPSPTLNELMGDV